MERHKIHLQSFGVIIFHVNFFQGGPYEEVEAPIF